MNNFEKWKKSIDIDDNIITMFLDECYCGDCPAYESCKYINLIGEAKGDNGLSCRKSFEEWAIKED